MVRINKHTPCGRSTNKSDVAKVLSLNELRQHCRSAGLKVSGSKAELMVRLKEAVNIGCPSEESTSGASEMDSPSSLDRTEYQVQKQAQVQAVLQRLDKYREPVRQLKNTASSVVESINQGWFCLEDAIKLLQESQNIARNRGEDLLEHMLALDKLTGLSLEDRASRKVAVAALDALLEEVDSVKSDLAGVKKGLNAKLAAQQTYMLHRHEPWTSNHASDDDVMIDLLS